MRSKTEYRRCGCGAILSLRESCSRCASAERARLHAQGIGHKEGCCEFRGDGGSMLECDREETAAREAARARWDAIKLPREYFCVPPPGERAARVHSVLIANKILSTQERADRDAWLLAWLPEQRAAEAAQDEARTQQELAKRRVVGVDYGTDSKGAVVWATMRADGTIVVDEVAEYKPVVR